MSKRVTSDFILKDPSTMENKLYRHRKGSLETRESWVVTWTSLEKVVRFWVYFQYICKGLFDRLAEDIQRDETG